MDKHRIFENGDTVVLGLFCFSLNKLSWWSYETDNYIYVRQGLLNRLFALEQKGHFFHLEKKEVSCAPICVPDIFTHSA